MISCNNETVRVEKSIHFSKATKKKKSVPAETYFLLFLVALHPRLFSMRGAALTRKRSIHFLKSVFIIPAGGLFKKNFFLKLQPAGADSLSESQFF